MTDRELMGFAAKAAGYKVRWHEIWKCFVHAGAHNITQPPSMAGQRHVWVPLDDDGDAMRLAFKLGMQIHCDDVGSIEAVRLDIVRAAAEIGKSMEKSQ